MHRRFMFFWVVLGLAAPAFAEEAHLPAAPLSIATAHGTVQFTVEVATTPAQQEHGLMFRKSLPEKEGMIFYFPAPRPVTMWMKNTRIPLDMVFIDEEGIVAKVAENAVPESESLIMSGVKVRAVLEIAGGAAARLHIAPGDKVFYAGFP